MADVSAIYTADAQSRHTDPAEAALHLSSPPNSSSTSPSCVSIFRHRHRRHIPYAATGSQSGFAWQAAVTSVSYFVALFRPIRREYRGPSSLLSPISILRVASLLGRSRLADSSFLPPTRAEMFLPDLLRPLNAPSYHRRENRTHATHAMAKSRPASAPRYLHHFRATEVASYKKLDPDYSTRQLNR